MSDQSNYEHTPEREAIKLGLTIAICCHNGEKRLPATLSHIRSQRGTNGLKWEVLVIDNASTDKSALLASELWGEEGPAPLRIVCEPRLGLSYARERAFEQAQYEIVSFVDDDNWIDSEWVRVAIECMSADPELGAIGSVNTAVADVPFPEWFSRYCQYYAAAPYHEWEPPPAPWALTGAGMTIRKSAWNGLRQNGFKSRLTDRVGTSLSSCGDLEIGCALQLAGWKIRIEPRLQIRHYMPSERLDWRYLRRLLRTIGESHALLESYIVPFKVGLNPLRRLRQYWWFQAIKRSWRLFYAYSWLTLIRSLFRDMEGNDKVAEIEWDVGNLLGLLRLRSRCGQARKKIAQATWRRVDSLFETGKPDYLMVLPVRHFRVNDQTIALESAFADHLRMMRSATANKTDRLVVASPLMNAEAYKRSRPGLSLIDERSEQILFSALPEEEAGRSIKARLRQFWPVMRSLHCLVERSYCVHSGLSSDVILPVEFIAILFGVFLKRRTVFVVDIDYRQSAYMSYRTGAWSLKSYLLCKYIYDTARATQLRIAARYCSLVLLKGRRMVLDFGKGHSNVKDFLDASHSEANIIDNDSLTRKIDSLLSANSPLRLIYFGRLTAYKGVDRCLRAVVSARRAGSNLTLDLIGDGEELESLREMTRDLNASEYVTFHGARPFDQELFRLLYGFHLLLAAPLREDTPRSALDAMAAGIPYLGFDTYYYRQLLESGAGVVVPWCDVEAMTRSLIRLATNRQEIVQMANNAVEFARLNTQEIWLNRRLEWTLGMDLSRRKSLMRHAAEPFVQKRMSENASLTAAKNTSL
jgi:glycosyltransferase involved in cell wall biosynthesis